MYYDDSDRHDEEKQQLDNIRYSIEHTTMKAINTTKKTNNWIRYYFYWIYCIKCDINKEENQQPIRTKTDNDILSYFYKTKTTKGNWSDQPRESQVKDHAITMLTGYQWQASIGLL